MNNQAEKNRAYYRGRFDGEFHPNDGSPYENLELSNSWRNGVRDIKGEIKLDNDTEWD